MPQRLREETVEEESRGVGCKRRQVILVTYSHGALFMGTLEHLEMEVGEEDCVQVIRSLINVLFCSMHSSCLEGDGY